MPYYISVISGRRGFGLSGRGKRRMNILGKIKYKWRKIRLARIREDKRRQWRRFNERSDIDRFHSRS
jgi:hypothetical protein